MLNLSIEELETLRRFQHSKEFEPYWVQITCILMLAHGHDAETISYDLGISPSCVYNCAETYRSGGISKLTDNHYKGHWGLLDSYAVVYYADGVHPTHNSRYTYAWVEKGGRMEQPTVSGRDRINLNEHL